MDTMKELEKNLKQSKGESVKSKDPSPNDPPEWVDHLEKNGTARYSYGFDEVEVLLWSK